MKLKYMTAVLTALCIFMGAEHVMAQKSNRSFERIESITPWLQSANSAGLVFDDATGHFSSAYAHAGVENNGFRNYNQAKEATTLGLGTKSYTNFNNFYFYGKFEYNFTSKKDQTWLGTTFEDGTLAPIVEDIPGKVVREVYDLNAKIAYKVSDRSAFGISFDYTDATAAKKKDGRNSNVYSNLNVSPAYAFSSEHVNFGIGLNYMYNAEKVNYAYFGDLAGRKMYYMEGLFMYTSVDVNNTMNSERTYQTNTFGGSAQLELKFGCFSFFNQFQTLYGSQDMYEDYGLVKRYAVTDNLRYTYKGILKLSGEKMENSVHLNFANNESLLYNIANVYEEIEGESNQWQYNEYGRTLRYSGESKSYGAMYHGFVKRDEYLQNIDFTLGFTLDCATAEHKLYPAEYYQSVYTRNYFAGVNKSLMVKENGYFVVGISAGLSNGNGTMLSEKNPISDNSNIKMHKDLIETDFLYKTAEKYNIGCSLKYSHAVNKEKGMAVWVKANYTYNGVKMPELNKENAEALSHFEKDFGHCANISVGLNF